MIGGAYDGRFQSVVDWVNRFVYATLWFGYITYFGEMEVSCR